MKQWTYTIVESVIKDRMIALQLPRKPDLNQGAHFEPVELYAALKELGELGWELAGIHPYTADILASEQEGPWTRSKSALYVFKRPLA